MNPRPYLCFPSYQTSVDKFAQNGFPRDVAVSLMRRAVELAHSSVQPTAPTSLAPASHSAGTPSVCLSLSCYGAMCVPGQEYAGVYPSPFGPPNTPRGIETALADFHYDRLMVFAAEPSTWHRVATVAFETVPLLQEGRAIRKAVAKVRTALEQRGEAHWPAWWISFVFPEGRHPGSADRDERGHPAAATIAREMLAPSIPGQEERPTGLGVNCTKLRYLQDLVHGYEIALRAATAGSPAETNLEEAAPWLVLYPDGGLTYDVHTRTWHADGQAVGPDTASSEQSLAEQSTPAQAWARQLVNIGRSAMKATDSNGRNIWSKLVLGGCCKASPEYIAELSQLARTQWPRTSETVLQ